MTREQQKQLKLLKNSVMKIALPKLKEYKLKRKDYMVWQQKNGLFFTLLLSVTEKEGKCVFSALEQVKPLWSDDLLWDILDMLENKTEPQSLRSTGAYSVYGTQIVKTTAELPNWELCELEEQISLAIQHFYQSVQTITETDFYQLAEQSGYQSDLMKVLILIHSGQYLDAISFIDKMESDYFSNAGQGFRERAYKHCNELLK